MNRELDFLKKHGIKPVRIKKTGKVLIIDTDDDRYVLKENKHKDNIYRYLKSRNFDYLPTVVTNIDEDYIITRYEDNIEMPVEQKVNDMIDLLALLHSKTSFYKEVDNDEYKKIYEDLNNNVLYLYSFYSDMITVIESKVYMSPSQYLLARNITKIFYRLEQLKREIESWFDTVKDKKKIRNVVLHNNLDISHFIKNENSFFINWDKSKIDMPIFDLYKLYLKNDGYDFTEVLKRYEDKYPLLNDERNLLLILIRFPDILEVGNSELQNTRFVKKVITNIDRSENILPNYSENKPN